MLREADDEGLTLFEGLELQHTFKRFCVFASGQHFTTLSDLPNELANRLILFRFRFLLGNGDVGSFQAGDKFSFVPLGGELLVGEFDFQFFYCKANISFVFGIFA